MSAPERIWLDSDAEQGDGQHHRCFDTPKPASEPAMEFVRADLAPQWQDIATAPKDGTEILITDGQSTYFGCFYLGEWIFCNGVATSCDDKEIFELNSWIAGYGPTHWMPLPTPPEPRHDTLE